MVGRVLDRVLQSLPSLHNQPLDVQRSDHRQIVADCQRAINHMITGKSVLNRELNQRETANKSTFLGYYLTRNNNVSLFDGITNRTTNNQQH
jgi:hypothetical protein